MAVNLVSLGRRLKSARDDRRITQEVVAAELGIPRTAIVQIEAGNRSISTLEILQLATLYNRPVAEFFSEADAAEDDPILALHRVTETFNENPSVQAEVSRCVEICREGAGLERLLGKKLRSGPPFYNLPEPRSAMDAVQQGSGVAAEERKRLDLGDAPIHALPDLLSNQGVWVAGTGLPDSMSGLFLQHSSIGMVILVNSSHQKPRKRFSYAHEYAHALMDRNRTAIVSTTENSRDRSETRANAFAAAFLIPEAGVRTYLGSMEKGLSSRQTQHVYNVDGDCGVEAFSRSIPGSQTIGYQDAASLARYFGVSYQAAAFRLQGLDFVNLSERVALIHQEDLGNRYLRLLRYRHATGSPSGKESPEEVRNPELTSQVVYLAIEAFRRAEISTGRLLDLGRKLGISGRDLVILARGAL